MDQAVHAGDDLSKGAEGHQLDNLDGGHVAHLELVQEQVPGVGLSGLVAQRNLLLLGVKADDIDVDLVAHLDNLGGVLDAAPAQLGNVHHAVHAADVDEGAVGSEALDDAMVLLVDLDLVPDLLGGSLAGLSGDGTDGADHSAAGAVDLGDLHADGLTDQLAQIAALGNAGLGSGNEHADALDIGNQAALVLLGDDALDDRLLLAGSLDLVPALDGVQTLLGQHHGALHVVDTDHIDLDLIAHIEQVLGLGSGIAADLAVGDVAGVLGAQVHIHFGGGDGRDDAGHLVSCI